MSHKTQFAGIVLNQNQRPDDLASWTVDNTAWHIQEFLFPGDYRRGTEADELRYPDLCGFQLMVNIAEGYASTASLEYRVEYKLFGIPWKTATEGTMVGAHTDGDQVWYDVYFDPISINDELAEARWRIAFRGRGTPGNRKDEVVPYDGTAIILDDTRIVVPPLNEEPYVFEHLGQPAFLIYNADANTVTFSFQQGITHAWVSQPNPLALEGNTKAYSGDGVTPALHGGEEFSFLFRVLALSADEGVDFLGNRFRSVVVKSSSEHTNTVDGADTDKIWLSGPQPSRFAVVSQYFDESDDGEPRVIDRVLLDPVTPGVFFHIYYSNEGEPTDLISEWENKLWIPVPRTYRATKRDTFALPEPIRAKYIKIEYSHLQAQSYTSGNFEQPIRYKKHPKWVLDYFLARTAAFRQEQSQFVANRVGVIYDAVDLAYNYYLDDIRQEPEAPVVAVNEQAQNLERFLGNRTDLSDQVDPDTLTKIDLALQPYVQHPGLGASLDSLLGRQVIHDSTDTLLDYPVELEPDTSTLTDREVPRLHNRQVVFEQQFPVMFFYLTARHRYREVSATLTHNRAYFAGVREVAFTREHYTEASDTNMYIEAGGDYVNAERNDFVNDDGTLLVEYDPPNDYIATSQDVILTQTLIV